VSERLTTEAERVASQASALEARIHSGSVGLSAIVDQRVDLLRRAEANEESVLRNQLEWEAVDFALFFDGFQDPTVLDSLRVLIRADSALAAAFREQAAELDDRIVGLASSLDAARREHAPLRDQERQLRSFAAEVSAGRTESEPTAQRLEAEAAVLRRRAERLSQEAKQQNDLAEALRVQGDRHLFPVRTRDDAMRFYGEDGRAVFRTLILSLGESGRSGSINSELVSDYAGPVRIGVGFVLAEARDGEDDPKGGAAASERFFAGGGNFVVYSSIPIAFHRSGYHSVTLQALNKVAMDVPGVRSRTAAEDVPTNVDLGMEVYGTFNTHGGRIKAFGLARSAVAVGNDVFYRNLGREGGSFGYGQVTLGAEIATLAKVLLSGSRAPEGIGRKASLTFQVSR